VGMGATLGDMTMQSFPKGEAHRILYGASGRQCTEV
jgi:hypothetical protein